MMHLSIHFVISVGFYVCFLFDLLNSVFILFNHSLAKQFSCGLSRLENEDWDKLKLGKRWVFCKAEAAPITSGVPLAAYPSAFTTDLPDGASAPQDWFVLKVRQCSLYTQGGFLQTLQVPQPKLSQPNHWDLEHKTNLGRVCLINLTDHGNG